MNKKNSPKMSDKNEPTLDFSLNTKVGESVPVEPTLEVINDSILAKETDVDISAFNGETMEHTPPATRAKGSMPDTFVVDSTQGSESRTGSNESRTGEVTLPNAKRSRKSQKNDMPSLVGKTIGDYRIDGELGRGGMGVVYRAHHQKLQRDVAIKMILGAGASDKQALERFEVEARAVASLQHSNFVQLFEFGTYEGSPFFALEYVDSGTLADRIKETALDARVAAEITEKMARAMHVAHEQGILHRDLKPANVLMTVDDEPKITDFGLAKKLVNENDQETKAGTVMGTPSFMSPEQAMGNISELTGATDQYSLGAVLYACISGRPPFMSASVIDTITQVVNKEPIPPRQLSAIIPIDLETICLKTLHKEADKRYSNCDELADDLRRFINGEPILARPISRVERVWRWCKRNPRVAIPSTLAGMFILLTAGVSSWAWAATSAQAAVIAQERDNVKTERDEAEKQRDEARRQKIIADQQTIAAERNEELARKQADLALKNIQFIVTDVDRKLQEMPGATDLRIGILETVSEKWDDLDVELAGGIRGQAIPTLMAVRQLIAIAFQDLDRLEEAQAEFVKLEEMARERIVVKGRTDAARLNLARVLYVSAPLGRRLENDPKAGIKKYDEALALVKEVIADPMPDGSAESENSILELLGAISQNRGVAMLNEGRLVDTERSFADALEATDTILANIRGEVGFEQLNENQRDAKTAIIQINADKMRSGLAYVRLRLGRTDEALKLFEQTIVNRREILDRRPKMLVFLSELAGGLQLYGKSMMWVGRLEEAMPLLRESVQSMEVVLAADPAKAQLKRSLADSLYLFGWVKRQLGFDDEALALLERSRILRAELDEASPDEKNRSNLMFSEAAVGNVDAAKEICDELGETVEQNAELHLHRAMALAELARHSKGEKEDELKNEALDALERSVAEGFRDPFRVKAELELIPLRDTARFELVIAKLSEAK